MKNQNKLWITAIVLIGAFVLSSLNVRVFPGEKAEKTTVVLVKYKALKGKEDVALTALTKLIEQVKDEPHFVSISLHVDPKDKSNILLYEQWKDESYYNTTHMTTPHLEGFIKSSPSFLAGPPEITFWTIESEVKK